MSDKLHEIVAKGLLLDIAQVNDALQYNSIPEWDSVAHMTLIANLEDEFGIMLDTDDIIAMSSVGTIREILTKYDVSV